MKESISSKFYHTLFLLWFTSFMMAQPSAISDQEETQGLESVDAPAGAIADHLWILVCLGLVLAYFKFRNLQQNKI